MLRIIDGIVFEGKPVPDLYNVTLHNLGNGHREVTVRPVVHWQESGPLHPDSTCAQLLRGERPELAEREAEDRERSNRLRAARRARTKVRRLCKGQGLDTLLTLTYRGNQRDMDLCKAHFLLFQKRMNRLLGRWQYVAAFERQQRGALHVHVATRAIPAAFERSGVKVKSFNVIRALWRAVTAEWGGNVDVSGKSRRRGQWHVARRSPARIATYLAKYMLKDWESWPAGTRRFQGSAFALPEPDRVQLAAVSFAELVGLCFAFGADGDCEVVGSRLGGGGTFYLATEGTAFDRSIHRGP